MFTTPDMVSKDLQNPSGEELRFVILATDGCELLSPPYGLRGRDYSRSQTVWDKLSSEEACLLAAAYYDRPVRDPIAKTHLPKEYPLVPPAEGVKRPHPAEPLPGTMGVYAEGHWVFQGDDNAATHLIRNAMGRGDDWERQRMLSLTGPMARSCRDDTTVT
jgi:pyruvate dehydrogenase phosphatase